MHHEKGCLPGINVTIWAAYSILHEIIALLLCWHCELETLLPEILSLVDGKSLSEMCLRNAIPVFAIGLKQRDFDIST